MRKKGANLADQTPMAQEVQSVDEEDRFISVIVGGLLFLTFAAAILFSLQWPGDVRAFPLVALVPGMTLSLLVFVSEFRKMVFAKSGGFRSAMVTSFGNPENRRSIIFLGYLAAILPGTLIFGQQLSIASFVFIYLVRWGRTNIWFAVGYTFMAWLVLELFYDRIGHIFWHKPYLDGLLGDFLPTLF
jgi:hypothetical protein